MDSTMIASNIRDLSRLELLVVVLQRVHRMLSELDRARYALELAPYSKGTSKQYVYRVSKEEGPSRITAIGLLMHRLLTELEPVYAQDATYQMLQRVFREHFVEADGVRTKHGQELSASSLASPDDLEASFRCKRGVAYTGYSANISETCAPENEVQLVVMVQTAPNTTNDDDLMVEALPELKRRLDMPLPRIRGCMRLTSPPRPQAFPGEQSVRKGRRSSFCAPTNLSATWPISRLAPVRSARNEIGA